MARRLPPGVHGPRADDGSYWASVELPGSGRTERKRRQVRGRTPREVADKLAALQRQVHDGDLPTGASATLGQWLEHWLTIGEPRWRPRTVEKYRWAVGRVKPLVGTVRLSDLTPEHVEHAYARLAADGLAPGSVAIVHAVLRASLSVATQRRRIPRDPMPLVTPPSVPYREMAALEGDEVPRVLAAAAARSDGARWLFGLAMGARQGEVLGLTWPRLDLDAGVVDLHSQLQWTPYAHGDGCRCLGPGGAQRCPSRAGGVFALVDVKSEKGRRRLPLPVELVPFLREHRARQVAARLALGADWQGWSGGELVFPTLRGRPKHRSNDRDDWQAVLDAAGVRRVRVHDARHTAATLMLELGVDVRVVAEWLGHASVQLTQQTYQHVTARLERDAADRVGAALWPGVLSQ